MKKIAQQIEELNENLAQQLPREILEVFAKSIADLKTLSIEDHAIKTGDKFPDFSLPNTNDKNVSLKELLKRGKVIIAFFPRQLVSLLQYRIENVTRQSKTNHR